jgi:hypothetical protein
LDRQTDWTGWKKLRRREGQTEEAEKKNDGRTDPKKMMEGQTPKKMMDRPSIYDTAKQKKKKKNGIHTQKRKKQRSRQNR